MKLYNKTELRAQYKSVLVSRYLDLQRSYELELEARQELKTGQETLRAKYKALEKSHSDLINRAALQQPELLGYNANWTAFMKAGHEMLQTVYTDVIEDTEQAEHFNTRLEEFLETVGSQKLLQDTLRAQRETIKELENTVRNLKNSKNELQTLAHTADKKRVKAEFRIDELNKLVSAYKTVVKSM